MIVLDHRAVVAARAARRSRLLLAAVTIAVAAAVSSPAAPAWPHRTGLAPSSQGVAYGSLTDGTPHATGGQP